MYIKLADNSYSCIILPPIIKCWFTRENIKNFKIQNTCIQNSILVLLGLVTECNNCILQSKVQNQKQTKKKNLTVYKQM